MEIKAEPLISSEIEQLNRDQNQFTLLASLQKLLKDEYFLLTTEHEQKMMFDKKLQNTLFSYYRSTVNLGESVHQTIQKQRFKQQRSISNFQNNTQKIDKQQKAKVYQQQKRLLQDQGFGDVYTFIKQIVLTFSKDPYLMMVLIQKHQNSILVENTASIARVIISNMYQNIVDGDVFNKDVLKIIIYCLKKLIQGKAHYYDINLQQKGFVQLLLSQIIQRLDAKQYSKQIVKNSILEIIKIDHLIQLKILSQEEKLQLKLPHIKMQHKLSSSKYHDGNIKNNISVKINQKKSKMKFYTECLKIQDEKIRKKSIIKRKYKNCISQELLNQLCINQYVHFPCFFSKNNEDAQIEQYINKQFGKVLKRSQSTIDSAMTADISTIKNIVLIFFNDIFKMLYSMPPIIRISSNILFKYLHKKFNTKNSLYVIADFVINFMLLSALQIDITMIQSSKRSPYLQQNLDLISLIIKCIVKDNYKDIDPILAKQFTELSSNLKLSISNYIYEIIKISNNSIDELCDEVQRCLENRENIKAKELKNIKSYCVCISMTDLKRFIEMIKYASKEITQANEKIMKRIQRIQLMSGDVDLFGDKKDKTTGKYYRASKCYALFTDLALPSHLSIDYHKTYNNSFKNNKSKNLLRQILLSLNDLQTYQQYHSSNHLQDFFQSLQFGGQDGALYSFDHISLKLRLEYLQILTRAQKLINITLLLNQETQKRFQMLKQTWQKSKQCYLRAITSINFQQNKLSIKQQYIRDQIKRRKLQQFFSKHEIKLCLTSPKTRQQQIVLKTNLIKNLQQSKDRLWLHSQSNCIHTALNLDFIKSLTGQPQKQKIKYESHINNIMKFSEILCSLPEVKERFNTMDDTMGIKEVFFQFIEYIRDLIRVKENQYAILLENIEWLQQNIQLKISKRLYEKLYPKYPLYDDVSIHLRLRTLDWIDFQHLDIDESLRNWKVLQVAANHLRLIDKLRTAGQKLRCIEQTFKIITNSYSLMSSRQKVITTDEIFPIAILVLIRSAPKRLISAISFIQCFASPSKLLSKEGSCLSQLKAAIQLCDELSANNISLCENQAANYIEFNKKIYEKQVEYGIYFLLARSKPSPKTQKLRMDYLKEYFKRQQQK